MDPWIVYCDGSAVPNPGRIGLGVLLIAPDGIRHALSLAPQLQACNNEAELRALMVALQELQARGARTLRIHCDNSVVVEQITNPNAKPIARLAALFEEGRALFQSFEQAELLWIPQHRNGEADALARAALGITAQRVAKRNKKRR
nr:ribonuclease HI family protein [uncultured Albidiferax sp.]